MRKDLMLNLFALSKKRLGGELIEAFKFIKGINKAALPAFSIHPTLHAWPESHFESYPNNLINMQSTEAGARTWTFHQLHECCKSVFEPLEHGGDGGSVGKLFWPAGRRLFGS
uniref:Uncharacterized protein n=1 Tax=Anguilla anguilla TaxID=7936 RepID=A0A0E9WZS2_ANGAN